MINSNEEKAFKEEQDRFVSKLVKYGINKYDLEELKKYYGYFWNKAHFDGVPEQKANLMILCNSEEIGISIMKDIIEIFVEEGLLYRNDMGMSFMEKENDVNQIIDIFTSEQYAENYKYSTILVAMLDEEGMKLHNNTLDVKDMLKNVDNNQIFYREFRYHIHLATDKAEFLLGKVLEKIKLFHTYTDKFSTEMLQYIRYVLPNREIKDDDLFINDIVDRVYCQYYGKYFYDKKREIDESCIPEYKKTNQIQKIVRDEIPEILDITDEELKSANISNVMVLNMSTLLSGRTIQRTDYSWEDDNSEIVGGYGHLDPTPQLLNSKLIKENQQLDLIIITASKETLTTIDFSIEEQGKEKFFRGSAVSFFKKRMEESLKTIDHPVYYRVIPIEDLNKALLTTTNVIREINKRQIEKCNRFKLYMDIHGGKREEQLLFDAIITILGIDDIHIHSAYTCDFEYGRKEPQIIKDVTEKLRIFRFVSGTNEFVNYGSAYDIADYIKNTDVSKEVSERRKNYIDIITGISDALTLCKTVEFNKKIISLTKELDNADSSDDLFEIFLNIVRTQYKDLLTETVLLKDKVRWAKEKHFYLQAITIIEADTPQYIFDNILDYNSKVIKIKKDNNYKKIDRFPFLRGEKPVNAYMRAMFYENSSHKYHWDGEKILHDDGTMEFKYKDEDGKIYKLYFKAKEHILMDADFWEKFLETGKCWWKIKKNIRNNLVHITKNSENISIESVDNAINEFLTALNEIDLRIT